MKQTSRLHIATGGLILAAAVWLAYGSAPQEADPGWPREIEAPNARVVIYQPQIETFEGNDLGSRAAVSVTLPDSAAPVFGVVWTTARVETDRDARTVSVLDVTVDRVKFPDATPEQESALAQLLEREIPQWDLTMSLDRLLTALAAAEEERTASDGLPATPPTVVFETEPTILVSIDGEPRMQAVENTSIMRVINTPFTILLAPDPRAYYLYAGDQKWYIASDVRGTWRTTTIVPPNVKALAPQEGDRGEAEPDTIEPERPGPSPRIMVATEPTELIVTEGEPEYSPIAGTDLLYMSNTESDVLLEIDSQRHYIVLSGRWYAADSLAGPWTHVLPDQLPATFADIPGASEMGHLLISVPGTEEANEAVLEHQIPQTTAIKRSEAKLDVSYDGDPQFEAIEDTEMEYAINTDVSVIRVGAEYYACHEAVWFVSTTPNGPWRVADEVPQAIYSMPPSAPVYNVKYVYVYDTTPDVVYVGYYPGYTHSYVYGGTIVYGTGFYYTPWYGSVYYGRPATWGWHVRYNPWYGWSYGFSYSTGPFTFAIGWGGGYGGYWGPVGYRGYHAGYHRGWHHGYQTGARVGYRAGFRAGTSVANRQNNIYNRPQNRTRNVDRGTVAGTRRVGTTANRPNNVFADRNGNIHRQTPVGWQTRSGSGWQNSGRAGTIDRTQLERNAQARSRGATRTQNFQRSGASRSARSRGGRRR